MAAADAWIEYPRSLKCLLYVLGMLLLVLPSGCAPKGASTYVMSEKTRQLPNRHQQQIEKELLQHFGTPAQPRLLIPAQLAGAKSDQQFVEALEPQKLKYAAGLFRRQCANCHGESGDGNGPAAAYLVPKPRDYRRGIFKFSSTPYGAKPRRADLIRTVRHGAKGTSMPAFPFLPDEDVEALVDYVLLLSHRGEVENYLAQLAETDFDEDEDLDPGLTLEALEQILPAWQQAESQIVQPASPMPVSTKESIDAGRRIFIENACSRCHGKDGRGQVEWLSPEFLAEQEALPEEKRIIINRDAWGHVAPAADLTAGMLHGGRRPIDVYRRISSGINGTPMPGFNTALKDEQIWQLVHFILSLVEQSPET